MKSKFSNLFRVAFDNFGTGHNNDFLPLQVERVTRPGLWLDEILGTEQIDRPDIELDLRDDVKDCVRAEVLTQLEKQTRDGAEFFMSITTLNQGDVIEQWYLWSCRIIECRFDELSCSAPNPMQIHLTIQAKRLGTALFGEIHELVR